MKQNILLIATATLLIACNGGGGHNADDGGFQQPIKPELNVSFSPGEIIPNASKQRIESLSRDAVAHFTVYARQGNTPVENGTEELLLSINDAIGTVPGVIYCYDFNNDACTETIKDSEGNDTEVKRPLGKVQIDLAAGRSYFSVTSSNGEVGEIGINITVRGPDNATVSEDIKIPVKYPSSGEPYQVNIVTPATIAPNSATEIAVVVTDEAGKPVQTPENNNLILTASNLSGTILGFKGETGSSVNAKTDATGVAKFSVLANKTGYLTLKAQADGADNNIENGFQRIVTASKTVQVTNATTSPTQNILITTGQLPNGVVGVTYESITINTVGTALSNFVLSAGSLPPGITFNRGVLSGIPTLAGDFTFTVTATGANGSTASQELTLKVIKGGLKFNRSAFDTIEVTRVLDPEKPDVCWAGAQTLTLEALDGYTLQPPFSWKMDAGGVSTALGASNNAERVVTANGLSLPNLDFTVTNDTTQVVLNGRVCPSAPDNVFSGHAIILNATDKNGFEYESVLPLVISRKIESYTPPTTTPVDPTTSQVTLISGTVGVAYDQSIIGARGSVTGGVVPPGLTYANGRLTGTPTLAGSYKFTVGNSVSITEVTVNIIEPGLTITPLTFGSDKIPAPMANATASCLAIAKTFTVGAVAPYVGLAPYVWKMDGGTVNYALNAGNPQQLVTSDGTALTGLTIAVTEDTTQVVVSGKLCSAVVGDTNGITGGHAIILRVEDANNTVQEIVFPYTITQEEFVAGDMELTTGTVGSPYSAVIPNATVIAVGSAPAGLVFNSGVLSGTPTVAGTFSFTVTLSNGGKQNISITIQP